MKRKKYKRKIIAGIGLLALFFLSYIRQSLFLVVNAIINGDVHNYSNYTPPAWIINNFTPQQLIILKWPLTLFFIIITTTLTILFLHFIFHDKKLNKFISLTFIVITILSFAFFEFGKLSGSLSNWYFWSHQLAMLCQSPLIYMICLPVYWYLQNTKKILT